MGARFILPQWEGGLHTLRDSTERYDQNTTKRKYNVQF